VPILAVAWLLTAVLAAQTPAFNGRVEFLTIRVQVVADKGKPLPPLTPAHFEVTIAGVKQHVEFAELIPDNDGATGSPSSSGGMWRFAKPADQLSAEYLLGVDASATDGGTVRVNVSQKNVGVRQWSWCAAPPCAPASGETVPAPVLATGKQDQPTFRATVNLIKLDVQMVSSWLPVLGRVNEPPPDLDKPLRKLAAKDFEVIIAGRKRKVTYAEFLHYDEGPVTRTARPSSADAATLATCVFAFDRGWDGSNAHYLLGIEAADTETGATDVVVRPSDNKQRAARWRFRLPTPADAPIAK
jgi:hypothetical protein